MLKTEKQSPFLHYEIETGHLTRANACQFRERIYMFDRFFEDAYVPENDGPGGRLIAACELRDEYPDDLVAGAKWSEQWQDAVGMYRNI